MSQISRALSEAARYALLLTGIVAFALFVAPPASAGQDPCPEGGTKVDAEGPMSFSCGEGQVITGICIKAGRGGFGVGEGDIGEGEGCYDFSDLGGSVGSVSGGGTGRDCKTISHSRFFCGPGEPPPRDPVCGDGIVEGEEQCDPPGRIDELLVCNDACRFVESPPPTEPVCGNGEVEAGEQCDPPGQLGEGLICTDGCQITEGPTEPPPTEGPGEGPTEG
jgi:hypothetical protein